MDGLAAGMRCVAEDAAGSDGAGVVAAVRGDETELGGGSTVGAPGCLACLCGASSPVPLPLLSYWLKQDKGRTGFGFLESLGCIKRSVISRSK